MVSELASKLDIGGLTRKSILVRYFEVHTV